DSVMDDIRQKLEEIIQAERDAIQRRLEANQSPNQEAGQDPAQTGQQGQEGEGSEGASQQSGDPRRSAQRGEGPQGAGQQTGSPQGGSGDMNQALREMLEGMARKHLDQLDSLPPQVGGQ